MSGLLVVTVTVLGQQNHNDFSPKQRRLETIACTLEISTSCADVVERFVENGALMHTAVVSSSALVRNH